MNPKKINQVTAGLLGVGLGAGLAIYLLTPPVQLDPLIGDPLTSKKYIHDLTVMGGKGNVLVAKYMAWFSDLWHGPQLGITVAVLTVIVTLVFRFIAARPEIYAAPPEEFSEKPAGKR